MRPLHYLLVHSPLSPAQLAARVQALGQAYGSNGKPMSGVDIVRWSKGQGRMPAWAHRAAFELALETGWPIISAEDCRFAVRTYRASAPDARLDDFRRHLVASLKDPPDLPAVWAADVAKHPYARMTAGEFDTITAQWPARGPMPSRQVDYARRVLVEGIRAADVAREANVARQAVSRAANKIWKRFRGGSP